MHGDVDELKRMNRAHEFAVEAVSVQGAVEISARFPDCKKESGERLVFVGGDEKMCEVMSFITEMGIAISKIERLESSLESLFMEVITK